MSGVRGAQIRPALEAADRAASTTHDYIYDENGVTTRDEANRAIWTIHDSLRPLLEDGELLKTIAAHKEDLATWKRTASLAANDAANLRNERDAVVVRAEQAEGMNTNWRRELAEVLDERDAAVARAVRAEQEREHLEARIGVLLAFARPVDIQAAELHIAKYGLLDAEGDPLAALSVEAGPCYCAETSTRNCPAHGQGSVEAEQ